MDLGERAQRWFSLQEDWRRPVPAIGPADLALGGFAFLLAALTLESMRSLGMVDARPGQAIQYTVLATGAALLVFRRRFPVVTMVLLALHFFIACTWVPSVGYSFTYQLIPFVGLYSGLAWARDRRAAMIATAMLALGFTVWLTWAFALGRALEGIKAGPQGGGPFSPTIGAVIFTAICNLIYFLAASLMGVVAWRQARGHALALAQSETIRQQTEEIAEAAVLQERLRLARELHDVVAHHIAVTGVQAGAARAVLRKDPQRACVAMQVVEESSREAVAQLRQLLVALRSDEDAESPGLDDVETLVRAFDGQGVGIDLRVVESCPGARARVPLPVGLTCYRVLQEALANVRRHSTARHVDVAVRVDEDASFAEVEVVDDGTPRQGTSGSGFGQRGMRERVAQLNACSRSVPASGSTATECGPESPPAEDAAITKPRDARNGDRPGSATPTRSRPRPSDVAGWDPVTGAGPVTTLRVLLVDDQAMIRAGFAMILDNEDDIDVIGQASNGAQAVELARELHPDVVLMDVQMPIMDGITACQRIVEETDAKVIIVTTFDRDDYLFGGLDAGASGFLLKNAQPEILVEAVRAVSEGHALLSPEVTMRVIRHRGAEAPRSAPVASTRLAQLTDREREVLELVGRGMSNAEIAAELFVGEATVKTHVSNVLSKLHLRDRVQAVILAYEMGLLYPGSNPPHD